MNTPSDSAPVHVPAQRATRHELQPALLTVPEAMAVLRVSRAAIYDLIRSRQLTSVKIGRSRRVPVTAIAEYVARLIEEIH